MDPNDYDFLLFGVVLESAREAGTTPYLVRWVSHDLPSGNEHEFIGGLTKACAEAIAARIQALGIDPHPFCGPTIHGS